ncbi:hypothetical protein AAHH88_00405 [Candidatus Hodgkinia cicadicola]
MFGARFESCARLDVELVLSWCASAVFVSVLSCSNVEVVAKLNTSSGMMASIPSVCHSFNMLVLGASQSLRRCTMC